MTCNSIDELDDFIAFVVLYAPNHFLTRHNMDLERAFVEIDSALQNCAGQIGSERKVSELARMSKDAKTFYERTEVIKGAHMLQDMAVLIKS